jgi:hypothetical protein
MEMLTAHNREILEGIDEIRLRLLNQQDSEVADVRSCKYRRYRFLSILTMICSKWFTRD